MSDLYHLWVQNQDGIEHCDNILLDDEEAVGAICKRLDDDERVADYTLEMERCMFSLTPDQVLADLEPFLRGELP